MITKKYLKECYDDSLNGVLFNGEKAKIIEFTEDKLKEILKNYYPEYIVQDWFDDEPEIDDEEFAMYMDYKEEYCENKKEKITNNGQIKPYSKNKHTIKELKDTYEKVLKKYKKYEKKRMKFNNWEDLYIKGNFSLKQKDVDKYCKQFVKEAIKTQQQNPLKFRFTKVQKDEKQICIFIFTRDILGYDTRIYFTKNGYKRDYKKSKFVKIRKK